MKLTPDHLICPLIVAPDSEGVQIIKHIPFVRLHQLAEKIHRLYAVGVTSCRLYVYMHEKSRRGSSGLAPDGLMIQAIRIARQAEPQMNILTEVCACAYTDNGECVLLDEKEQLDEQATLDYAGNMAVQHARAGCHSACAGLTHERVIEAMRQALDADGFRQVTVAASIQLQSRFYNPYRRMMHTEPVSGETHRAQIHPDDLERLTRMARIYERQGACAFIFQPVMPNIDLMLKLRALTHLPLHAYSVSAELPLMCDADLNLMESKRDIAVEYFQGLLRAGAHRIMTYMAEEIARGL